MNMPGFRRNLRVSIAKVHVNQWLPPRLQARLAEKLLIRAVHQAYAEVPYYRKSFDDAGIRIDSIRTRDDLKKLPFLTKQDVREHYPREIVAHGTNTAKCHYSATTGSTGRSLPFVFNHFTYAFYLATSLRVYTMFGYRPWHRIAYIKYTGIETPSAGPFFRANHISSILPVKEQIRLLIGGKPDLLVGYASIILEIARTITPDELKKLNFKFICVNSELSTQYERDFIAGVFGCPVYDEYSTEETWMVASQCREHQYHLFTDNVWVEFLRQDGGECAPGEPGEIILTTLRSPAMPFIRYRIGDLGRYSDVRCPCGRGFPVLLGFEGRSDDAFILPSGRYISPLKILNTFTLFMKQHLHLMEEFKVVQVSRGQVVIDLVKGKDFQDSVFRDLVASLRAIFNEPVEIIPRFVDAIAVSGIKRKAIESRINKTLN